MHKLILAFIFIIGLGIHVFFLDINSILKVADSFAYLQMSHYLGQFDIKWLWSGWFGFLYSLPVAFFQLFIDNPFFAWQLSNIFLFTITGALLYRLASLYLDKAYVYIVLILFFLSPTLMHYNIHILSENIYIPLFLWLYLNIYAWSSDPTLGQTIKITFIFALLYLTRWEAFIYLGAFYMLAFILFVKQDIWFGALLKYFIVIPLFFAVFISPYVYFLYTMTWEIGLTNKWASNLRQAELRWVEQMDDSWFEQAVAELTDDKHHLIAGFAGGMEYDKPSIDLNLKDYVLENKEAFFERFITNQKKLYTQTLPKMLFGSQLKLYYEDYISKDIGKIFWWFILFPIIFIVFGIYKIVLSKTAMITGDRSFFWNYAPFFIIASMFFTLFFVLERYFIVFLPLLLILLCYGIQYMLVWVTKHMKKIIYFLILVLLVSHSVFWLYGYYYAHLEDDDYYKIKTTAGLWLNENFRCEDHVCEKIENKSREKLTIYKYDTDFKIMERFPVVTYYSGTKHRYITPYTSRLDDIIEYARFNDIDFLVVDTLDFLKYRPELQYLLANKDNHKDLKHIRTFAQGDQRVILYQIEY